MDAHGSLHAVCEGSWTFYETAVFGDLDILYARKDPVPEAEASGAYGIQLETSENAGDGTGYERFDSVLIPGSDQLLPREAFALECRAISSRNNPNSETYFLAKEGPISSASADTLQLGQWRSGQADLRLATETQGYAVVNGPVLDPGKWYHLAATYDSQAEGDNLILYVNGINVGSVRAEGLVRADRGPLYLGGSNDVRKPGSVTLDEVRIWDHARTESEIVSYMNQALAGAETGLAAW